MRLKDLLNRKNYRRYITRLTKEGSAIFRRPVASTPIFVVGLQRSGTTMMMHVLQSNALVRVYNEDKNSRVFENHLLRSDTIVQATIDECTLPFVAYKPISDSHRTAHLLNHFPDSKALWMFRSFRDVINSTHRRWQDPSRALRLTCNEEPGGGWFQEGVSPPTLKVLQDIYEPDLSADDCLCLVWWARNQIVLEQQLCEHENFMLVDYDNLVQQRVAKFENIFSFLGVPLKPAHYRDVHAESVNREPSSDLNPKVVALCESLATELQHLAQKQNKA